MPHTLACDLAQRSLDVLLEHAGQSRNGSVDETKELLDNCEYPFPLIEQLRRSVQESLDHGVERRKFMAQLKDCLDVIERTIQTMHAIRERVKSTALPSQDKAAGLLLLDRLDRDTTEKRDQLTELLRWLEKPRPEIDLSLIAADGGQRDAKGFVDLDQLKADWFSDKDD
jgi:hypothetical protein